MAHFIRDIVKTHTTIALRTMARDFLKEIRVGYRHHVSLKQAKRFSHRTDLKLNLACGSNFKTGWVNIDIGSAKADLRLDLRETFPFASGSVSIVYNEHFFEHLEYPGQALRFLRESWRVLSTGGIFSIGVPDCELSVTAYVTRNEEYYEHERKHWHHPDMRMHYLNFDFRQGREHKYAYDFEILAQMLVEVGFVSIVRRSFNPALDSPRREWGTLYVEARKPEQ